ncbi:expressed unknown protein [Seminavis robusta]|uniref:Uncharacterized protein n=1 Tax=Seminavis robusta TaxID=568900 RepID=A0A9N8E1J3_9STRA|nr:expressed unknown protein [Seminavis robusta]|eukprot:Sro463_g148310.1 n/a (167) ;mRNA; r:58416-58916
MSSPLHAFMSELRGASTSIEVVSDNATAPANTMSQERQECSHDLPSKPIRPHRIAAKGISFLASNLPAELRPVMKPIAGTAMDTAKTSKLQQMTRILSNSNIAAVDEEEECSEKCEESIKSPSVSSPKKEGSRRSTRKAALRDSNHVRRHSQRKGTSKRVTTAYAA